MLGRRWPGPAGGRRTLQNRPESAQWAPKRPSARRIRTESYQIVRNRAESCAFVHGPFPISPCRASSCRFAPRKHACFSLRRRCLHPCLDPCLYPVVKQPGATAAPLAAVLVRTEVSTAAQSAAVAPVSLALYAIVKQPGAGATAAPLAAVLVRAEVSTATQSAAVAPVSLALYAIVKQLRVCARIARHLYSLATYLVFARKRYCWGGGPRGNLQPGRR